MAVWLQGEFYILVPAYLSHSLSGVWQGSLMIPHLSLQNIYTTSWNRITSNTVWTTHFVFTRFYHWQPNLFFYESNLLCELFRTYTVVYRIYNEPRAFLSVILSLYVSLIQSYFYAMVTVRILISNFKLVYSVQLAMTKKTDKYIYSSYNVIFYHQ